MGTWDHNIRALSRYQPALAEALVATASLLAKAEACPDGGYSVRTGGDAGPWVHSRRAPLREIDRLVEPVDPKPYQPIVMIGIGLGDALERLLRAFPKHSVCVLEHNVGLVRAAYERFDFSAAISDGRVTIACDLEGHPLAEVFEACLQGMMLYGRVTVAHAYTGSAEGYGELLRGLGEWTRQKELEIRTSANGARHNIENLAGNLPNYLSSTGIAQCTDTFRGVPAVLVGAGPSLRKNLDVLRAYSGRVVVLAVSSALRRVMAAGVEVQATNVVDYSHLSERYFRDLAGDPPPLIGHPRCNHGVMDGYGGPIVTCGDEWYASLGIEGEVAHGDYRWGGNNVAHIAYQALRTMGCDPIILCGLDLAYTSHITHVPGSAIHDEWAASTSRFCSLEFQELQFLTGGLSEKCAVTDAAGNKVYNDELMESAARFFESMFRDERAGYPERTVVNATEGGRKLKGVPDTTLRDALERYASKTLIDQSAFRRVLQEAEERAPGRIRRGRSALVKLDEDVRRLKSLVKPVREHLKRTLERMDRGEVKEFHTPAFDRLSDALTKTPALAQTLSILAAGDRLHRKILEARIADERASESERLRALAEKESLWAEALEGNSDILSGIIERNLKRIDQRLEKIGTANERAMTVGAREVRP